jgi:Tol biopolymer transport system component
MVVVTFTCWPFRQRNAHGEPKRLTFGNRGVFGPVWTPDGQGIVFASGDELQRTLWRINAFGSANPQRPRALGIDGSQPAISPQRHRLAYTHQLSDENIWRLALTHGKPTPATSFISSTQIDSSPQYSPDGKKIAFSSGRSSRPGGYEIWICSRDGSDAVELTSMGAESGFPRWSPDGERIAFDSNAERQYDIYVINANGEKPLRLTSDPSTDALPSWSRDGKWIYFASDRSGDYQVWKMPSNGGAAVQVSRGGGFAAFESPDRKSVYYTKSQGTSSLWKISEGGDETEVLPSVAHRSFAVVEKGIYFISRPSTDSDHVIQFFDFGSQKSRLVAAIGKIWPTSGFTVSPDGQTFLYSTLDGQGSDLMLVENFR